MSNNRILLLDEPTANVDMETDRIVQEVIRSDFKECTILTIAHRLDTVIDSDMIVVIEAGEVRESGPPFKLLAREDSDTKITARTAFAEIVTMF